MLEVFFILGQSAQCLGWDMSEEWRTDMPESGQVAWVRNGGSKFLAYFKKWRAQEGGWWSNGTMFVGELCDHTEWLPAVTNEEQRLHQRVRELEDGVRKHAGASVSDIISEADLELWALLEGGG